MHSLMINSALLALVLVPAVNAAGPTGQLNDTGLTQCVNAAGTALEACSQTNTGDASARPRQDGRMGRDPAAANPAASGFSKPAGSSGEGGFAFTPLDVSGTAIALTGNPPTPSATPRCIWDRVTNLFWEVKTDNAIPDLQDKDWTYAWGSNPGSNCFGGSNCNTNNYITALNAASVCPVSGAGAWRLPTRRELLSIVDFGHTNPSIDPSYFPNTAIATFWSNEVYVPSGGLAWVVRFSDGGAVADVVTAVGRVRLVRSGP